MIHCLDGSLLGFLWLLVLGIFEENFGITTMGMVGEIGLIFRLYRVLLLKAIEAAAFCFAFCYNYAIHLILVLLTTCQFL